MKINAALICTLFQLFGEATHHEEKITTLMQLHFVRLNYPYSSFV